jgi:hypothetical protein
MKLKLLRKAVLDYPSGSALEYHKDSLYVIGDDVHYILCLDAQWNVIRHIQLFESALERIPKPDKPDIECAAVIDDVLYLLGSGSKSPQRDVAFIVQLSDYTVKKINTAAFYGIFRDRNLMGEMNIEGFTGCKDKLLLFNRANTSQPNSLIVTDRKIVKRQFPDRFKVMPVEIGSLNNIPLGISGASYCEVNDILFITASAENTDNTYDDGDIIGSVLGIVYNASDALNAPSFIIEHIIELDKVEKVFSKQKMESVCITRQENKNYTCILVADNDDGKSVLFEMDIQLV